MTTTFLPNYNISYQRLPNYNRAKQRLPAYGRAKLQMPKLERGDLRIPNYPLRMELQMLEPMVDILTSDYYHLEHTKRPPRIRENNSTAAIGGGPFNSKGLVTTMLDSKRPKKIELSISGMASYPKSHRHVYPLGLS